MREVRQELVDTINVVKAARDAQYAVEDDRPDTGVARNAAPGNGRPGG
jgi:hypothetical protein